MSGPTPPTRAKALANVLDWGLRIVLALLFVDFGADKLGSRRLWIQLFADIGIGQWFRYATGLIELVGGLLLLLPPATPIAVFMLACTMVGALLAHVFFIGIGPATVFVAVLLTLLATIGWRRHTTQAGDRTKQARSAAV